MAVYVIRAGDDGAVKIGVARNVLRRIATLQNAHPSPLTLLRAVQGGVREEQRLHAKFAQHRIGGEWFSPVQEVLDAGSDMLSVDPTVDNPDPFLRCPLTVWRENERKTCADVARILGVEPNAISRYERANREPSLAIMHAIRIITDGAVTPNDWADWSVALHALDAAEAR